MTTSPGHCHCVLLRIENPRTNRSWYCLLITRLLNNEDNSGKHSTECTRILAAIVTSKRNDETKKRVSGLKPTVAGADYRWNIVRTHAADGFPAT